MSEFLWYDYAKKFNQLSDEMEAANINTELLLDVIKAILELYKTS